MEFNLQKVLPALKAEMVTGSAFTQARYKIRHEFFIELFRRTISAYAGFDRKTWKGHRLIAGDGSTLNLPITQSTLSHFGLYSEGEQGRRTCLARAFFLYDILNDFIVHGDLSTMKTGEKALLMKSLPEVADHNDVYILDRAFGHFCTLAELMQHKKRFCVRIPIATNFAKAILKNRISDLIIDWVPSKKEIQNSMKNKMPVVPIKVRVVKVKLPSGQTELLATNLLNPDIYTKNDIGLLYRYRWGIEEGIKKLKPKMKVEQFGCRKAEGVFQEFYAHIFCFNMISMAGAIASQRIDRKTAHRRDAYKYNWQNAYRFFRDKIIAFVNFCRKAEAILDELVQQIARSVVAIRPGRKFIRDMRNKNRQRRITPLFK